MIGDISQPRGGPMLSGHASHQIGLDADIWLTPMPSHTMSYQEREGIPEAGSKPRQEPSRSASSLKNAVETLERDMIVETLRATGNNQQKAARELGLSRQGLINKIKRYRLTQLAH